MESLSASDVILGLLGLIMTMLSVGIRMLWTKVVKCEEKIDKQREDMHGEMKEIYAKHDTSSEKLRTEIRDMSESLRKDMTKQNEIIADNYKTTNELLVKIASK